MPKFPKSDGFSLGGNPFTMKKGSKEINTEGSFRQEATGKMGSYGSPLFAIAGRDASSAGAAYDDSSVTDIEEAVDGATSEGQAGRAQLDEKNAEVAKDAISNPGMDDKKETGGLGNTKLSDSNPTGEGSLLDKDKLKEKLSSIASII